MNKFQAILEITLRGGQSHVLAKVASRAVTVDFGQTGRTGFPINKASNGSSADCTLSLQMPIVDVASHSSTLVQS